MGSAAFYRSEDLETLSWPHVQQTCHITAPEISPDCSLSHAHLNALRSLGTPPPLPRPPATGVSVLYEGAEGRLLEHRHLCNPA